MGCRELQGCVPESIWLPDSAMPVRQLGWDRTSLALLAMAWVQISRYLFAETSEGGKSRNTLLRYLRECRDF